MTDRYGNILCERCEGMIDKGYYDGYGGYYCEACAEKCAQEWWDEITPEEKVEAAGFEKAKI